MPAECSPPPPSRNAPSAREARLLLARWRREVPGTVRVPWLVRAEDGSVSVVYARVLTTELVHFEGDAVRCGRPPEALWWTPIGPGGTIDRDAIDPARPVWSLPTEPAPAMPPPVAPRAPYGVPAAMTWWTVPDASPGRWRITDHDGRLRWFAAPWLVLSYGFVCDLALDGWTPLSVSWAVVLLAGLVLIAALYLRRVE